MQSDLGFPSFLLADIESRDRLWDLCFAKQETVCRFSACAAGGISWVAQSHDALGAPTNGAEEKGGGGSAAAHA